MSIRFAAVISARNQCGRFINQTSATLLSPRCRDWCLLVVGVMSDAERHIQCNQIDRHRVNSRRVEYSVRSLKAKAP